MTQRGDERRAEAQPVRGHDARRSVTVAQKRRPVERRGLERTARRAGSARSGSGRSSVIAQRRAEARAARSCASDVQRVDASVPVVAAALQPRGYVCPADRSDRTTPPSAKCVFCAFCQPPKTSSIVNSSIFGNCAGVLRRDRRHRAGGRSASRRSPGPPACRGTRGTPRRPRACRACPTTLSTTATGGSARMLSDGTTISNLSLPELLQREERLVLPGDQHVADAALTNVVVDAARAGVEHRHVLVELARRSRCAFASLPPGCFSA